MKFRISFSCGLSETKKTDVYKLQSYLYFCVGVKLGVILWKENVLKALNNIVLKGVFGDTESIKGWWITIHILCWLSAIVNENTSMRSTSSKCEEVVIHTKFWWENIKERDHSANLGVEGTTVVVKKQDVKDWTGWGSKAVVQFCDRTD